ncbi:hypothetical protein DCAR_0414941 [Daucus carota subsp. sativus]|uniref:Uncharacterized protein n=1 Tax=Daucus carota subsp. sativus TaxID=79200 RepID=A0A165A3Z5_DAUCS|nr:hypothetical protein DCAR_0414941 [Daucus carota subsp. sativus]
MQAIKGKLLSLKESRSRKFETKEEEKAEKEKMKDRTEVAHEVHLAREAEAEMDHHVKKAAEKAAQFEQKHPSSNIEDQFRSS